MEHKTFRDVTLKDDGDKGELSAVFATFDVIDHDGDVVLPSAIEDGAKVRISAYNHASWGGVLPVGKGTVHTTKSEAIVEAQFTETQAARDTFATIKAMGDLQEYSWGFDIEKYSFEEREDRQVRILERVKLHEVSPVLLGASIGTRTLATKSGLKFSEHADAVLTDVAALINRATEVVTIRAREGKTLGSESVDLLARLDGELKRLTEVLATPQQSDLSDELTRLYARSIANLQGV